jgi:NAD(P)-dependent dehydrogenase (short-subunit alcohol dehydrogenase family)
MATEQRPLPSGFTEFSTAEEVCTGRDLSGTTAIVTGGYSGLGTETTRVLAACGATVVVPARNMEKARANLAGIPRVEIAEMDLLDPASIERFAAGFLASGRSLPLLINSAGIMAPPLARDARGYESQFSTNHLGHFHLTARLWPALVKAQGARVVALSSRAYLYSRVDFEDPNCQHRDYNKWAAYGQSKTAIVLFALELDRRGEGAGVRGFSVHPGSIATDLGRDLTGDDFKNLNVTQMPNGETRFGPNLKLRFKTLSQGAATTLWCATSPQLNGKGGVYCEDCDIAAEVELNGPDIEVDGVAAWACDSAQAKRLWTLSEALTGVSFTP